jgi:hypothetical protein
VGDLIIATDPVANYYANRGLLHTAVNLFLELFGQCALLSEDLHPPVRCEGRRLSWRLLPPGEFPWTIDDGAVTDDTPPGQGPVLWQRIHVIKQLNPSFCTVGTAGFREYWVFGFPERGIYVLESPRWGNATYVLGKDWEAISQMSKAEILHGQLHLARLIHRQGWERELGMALVRQSRAAESPTARGPRGGTPSPSQRRN